MKQAPSETALAGTSSAAVPTYVDNLPAPNEISPGSVFIIRNYESRYLTHKFHKYAGKFIPELPRWAMSSYLGDPVGAVVLDPFVGSGTTLVEASIVGADAYGLDVDPLARLIAKVKTTPLKEEVLAAAVQDLLRRLDTAPAVGRRPEIPTLYHWFTAEAVEGLSAVRGLVDEYIAEPDLHDFLTVCFSATIRRASNADNQTMKTYVSHTHPKRPEDPRQLFRATLLDYAERLRSYGSQRNATSRTILPIGLDARTLAAEWDARKLPPIDLAVTSPPYIKSVDYVYNQMAELFWIGDRWGLEDQKAQNSFKRRYMGTERVASPGAEQLPVGVEVTDVSRYVAEIAVANPKLSLVASKYFADTVSHFRNMSRVLKADARYVYIVGDSTLAGVSVPTHELVTRCAEACGFALELCFGYEIRNKHMRFPRAGRGGHVVHDWVLTFRMVEGPDERSQQGEHQGRG